MAMLASWPLWDGSPRRRSATARSVLAGEASAEAARKTAQAEAPPHAELPEDEAPPALPATSETPATDAVDTSPEPEFPVPGDDLAAAFFDLDNTVMQGAAIFHFGRGLYKREFFRRRELARFAWQQAWFRLMRRRGPGPHAGRPRQRPVHRQGPQGLRTDGHRRGDLRRVHGRADLAGHPRPGPGPPRQPSQKVWLVTAAPVETATIIARRLGLTGALGTVAESVDGIYTGRLVGEPLHGPAKAEAVRALAAAEELDLARCAAYSDSHNDIPMLSLVGHPYAINPDTKLRKHARANDWRLRDYRTGRKAVKVGVPAAAGVGALAGGAAAAIALHRRRK